MFFEQHLIYFIREFIGIPYAIKKRTPSQRFLSNADGGTRTHTSIRTTDFESVSSASSDTSADSIVRLKIYYHF